MHDPRRYLAASLPALAIAGLTPLGTPIAQAWPAQIITLLLAVIGAVLLLRRTTPAQGASASGMDAPEATPEALIARLLQRLAGSNLLGLMAVDREARVHVANDAALGLLGHVRDELEQGRLSWNAIAPPAWHDLGKLVLDATGARKVRAGDTVLVHRNGARVPVRIEVMPLDAGAEHFLVLLLDTSRATRTEAELASVRTQFERYKVLFDSTPVALFAKEYRGEKQGTFILANPMSLHVAGVSHLIGRTNYDVFPPEVAAHMQASDRRVMEGGEPLIVEEWAPDPRTGKLLCFITTKVPLRDSTGRPYGIGGAALDVTQQKLLTERLALVHAIPDTLIRIDADGRILDINDRGGFIEGSGEELIGTSLWDRPLPAEVQQHLLEATRRALETGQLQEIEHSLNTPEGTWYYEARLVKSGEREVVALVRDITEARRTRAELQATNARLQATNDGLKEFAYVASHDLQEPLRTVQSFAELLERKYGEVFDDKGRQWFAIMVGGIQRMRTLIDDLLAYSRIGTTDVLEPVDTRALVQTLLDDMRASIEETSAEIHVGDLPHVVASELELKQVFQNLISNGLKFRRTGVTPRLRITAAPVDHGWSFTVADNGIGIDPAHHDRIFQMFQRLHSRDEYPGTGIGLALVKKIIERHSGAITLRSTPGEGTEIQFTIPALAVSRKTAAPAESTV